MEVSVNVNIAAPKGSVWRAIVDIENCQEMITAIIDLKVLEQPESGLVGLKWQETREMFGKAATETMWVTECQDGDYYQTRAENCGAIYISKLSVTEIDADNTTLTMSFSGQAESFIGKVLSRIMGLLMKKSMIKMLDKDLDDIKHFVEANRL